MKVKLFASTLLAAAASLLMTATPASAQNYGFNGQRGTGDIVLFEHGNYQGRALPLNRSNDNLGEPNFNDIVSSVLVREGRWELCSDWHYEGRCQIVDADIPNMNYLQMNDVISSVRRIDGGAWGYGRDDRGSRNSRDRGRDNWGSNRGRGSFGYARNDPSNGSAGLVVYEHSQFNGWAIPINSDIYDFAPMRVDNQISSIHVNFGRWSVCTDSGFRGRCETISRSDNAVQLNDQISSIRRLDR